MKTQHQARLSLEQLEDRSCPTVSISLQGTALQVSGSPIHGSITIQEVQTNGYDVYDGNVLLNPGGRPYAAAGGILLQNLTGPGSPITINLGGLATGGNISANLGSGNNNLTVENGSLSGMLAVSGKGNDFVELGGNLGSLQVAKDVTIDLPGTTGLQVDANATLSQSLTVLALTNLNLVAGSQIVGSFAGVSRAAGATFILAGNVEHTVTVSMFGNNSTVNLSGTEGKPGTVGVTTTLGLVGGNSKVNFTGTSNGGFWVNLRGGSNSVTVAGGSSIHGGATIDLGNGASNNLVFNGAVTKAASGMGLLVTGSGASDSVTLGSSTTTGTQANIGGNALVELHSNNNIVSLKDGTIISGTLTATAPNSSSVFHGSQNTSTHKSVIVHGFQWDKSPNP